MHTGEHQRLCNPRPRKITNAMSSQYLRYLTPWWQWHSRRWHAFSQIAFKRFYFCNFHNLRQLSRYSSPKCHASGQSRRLNPRFAGRSVNSLVAPSSQVSLPLSSSPLRHGNPRGRPKGSSLTLLSRHYPVLASLPAGSNPSPLAYPTPLARCGGTCTNTFWTHVPVSIGALPSGASTR